MRGFWWSFVVAFAMGALVVGLATAFRFSGHREAVAVGWKLVPVLIAAADLNPGTRLGAAEVVTLEIPEQFVSDSNVIADDQSLLLDQEVEEPVLKGDPLVWSMFDRAGAAALTDCLEAVGPQAAANGTIAADVVGEEFAKQRRKITVSDVHPPPVANGTIAVLAVTRDIEAGELIPLNALRSVALPEDLFTDSYVPRAHLRKVAGARAIFPLVEGEPLIWQMMDDPERPQSLSACRAVAARAESNARATTATTLAKEHFAKAVP